METEGEGIHTKDKEVTHSNTNTSNTSSGTSGSGSSGSNSSGNRGRSSTSAVAPSPPDGAFENIKEGTKLWYKWWKVIPLQSTYINTVVVGTRYSKEIRSCVVLSWSWYVLLY